MTRPRTVIAPVILPCRHSNSRPYQPTRPGRSYPRPRSGLSRRNRLPRRLFGLGARSVRPTVVGLMGIGRRAKHPKRLMSAVLAAALAGFAAGSLILTFGWLILLGTFALTYLYA